MTTSPVMTVTDELLAELDAGITSSKRTYSMTMRTADVSLIIAEICRLRADNAELEKDAGRYRHIRSDGIPDEAIAMVDSYYGELELVSPDRLDAAIDTAMAAQ